MENMPKLDKTRQQQNHQSWAILGHVCPGMMILLALDNVLVLQSSVLRFNRSGSNAILHQKEQNHLSWAHLTRNLSKLTKVIPYL